MYKTLFVWFVNCLLFFTADAGPLCLMWPLLRRQERLVSGGFIFITRWNSLGHVRKVVNSMVGVHEVFLYSRNRR